MICVWLLSKPKTVSKSRKSLTWFNKCRHTVDFYQWFSFSQQLRLYFNHSYRNSIKIEQISSVRTWQAVENLRTNLQFTHWHTHNMDTSQKSFKETEAHLYWCSVIHTRKQIYKRKPIALNSYNCHTSEIMFVIRDLMVAAKNGHVPHGTWFFSKWDISLHAVEHFWTRNGLKMKLNFAIWQECSSRVRTSSYRVNIERVNEWMIRFINCALDMNWNNIDNFDFYQQVICGYWTLQVVWKLNGQSHYKFHVYS